MGGVGATAAPAAVMARHGRSFHWASRLLATRDAERCARLYAFCRRVDDLADEGETEPARRALDGIRADLLAGASAERDVGEVLDLAAACEIPRSALLAFVDGVGRDLVPRPMASEAELIRYAYGVAGTVGLMLCGALGVKDPRALPFAVDLGVAMQLTNIARDVVEDAGRGRRYLPGAWLSPATTPEAILRGDPRVRADVWRAVRRLLSLAEAYYRSADRGMAFLPARARLGILTASRVYEAIGSEVLRSGESAYGSRRAMVSAAGKLRHTLRALLAFASPRSWIRPSRGHWASLHAPLRALPGADPAA